MTTAPPCPLRDHRPPMPLTYVTTAPPCPLCDHRPPCSSAARLQLISVLDLPENELSDDDRAHALRVFNGLLSTQVAGSACWPAVALAVAVHQLHQHFVSAEQVSNF